MWIIQVRGFIFSWAPIRPPCRRVFWAAAAVRRRRIHGRTIRLARWTRRNFKDTGTHSAIVFIFKNRWEIKLNLVFQKKTWIKKRKVVYVHAVTLSVSVRVTLIATTHRGSMCFWRRLTALKAYSLKTRSCIKNEKESLKRKKKKKNLPHYWLIKSKIKDILVFLVQKKIQIMLDIRYWRSCLKIVSQRIFYLLHNRPVFK